MRYKLPIDRSVNRLVPHYLSGRRFILFVQSCLYPLPVSYTHLTLPTKA